MHTSSISFPNYTSTDTNSFIQDDLFTINTFHSNAKFKHPNFDVLPSFPNTQDVWSRSENIFDNGVINHTHSYLNQSTISEQVNDFSQQHFLNNLNNDNSVSKPTNNIMKENQQNHRSKNSVSLKSEQNSGFRTSLDDNKCRNCLNSGELINPNTSLMTNDVIIKNQGNQSDLEILKNASKSKSLTTDKSLSSDYNSRGVLLSKRVVNIMKDAEFFPRTGIISPVPKLGHITRKLNCDPNIMRCTMNCIPCNEDILNKTHLPLVLMIHPFKYVSNLQVTKCGKIVRCQTSTCRAYLNPFVTLLNKNRWKCNFCQSINEFSNDFLYNESNEVYEIQKRIELNFTTLEYIVPMEYCERSSQVPVYVFMIDISANAMLSLYSNTMIRILNTIEELLEQLPGHQFAKFSIIGYDNYIHLYSIDENKCQEIIISDISSPIENLSCSLNNILVSIDIYKGQIREVLSLILDNVDVELLPQSGQSCLGSAILCAKEIIGSSGGRITIFNASCPSVGEGILMVRNVKKSSKVFPIAPNKEFYKTLSLECAEVQISVDLFQLGRLPCDLASLSIISRYCGGSLFYYPDLTVNSFFKGKENLKENYDSCILELTRLNYDLNRYLTREIGFDALLRVRYSSGLSVQSSHGNFFARACDLYALVNVNPDTGTTVRFKISNSLVHSNLIFFQASLLYTSCLGERRTRVHTLAVPVSTQISNVFGMADHQVIAGFLCKSVCDRLQSNGKVIECREALVNAVIDSSIAFGECCLKYKSNHLSFSFPYHLRLLPLYVWRILQSKCLSPTQNDPDQSVAILDSWRNLPLSYLLVDLCPFLFNLTSVAFLSSKQKEYAYNVLECTTDCMSHSVDADLDWNINNNIESTSSYDSENDSLSSWDSETSSGISCYDSKCDRLMNDFESIKRCESSPPRSNENLWFPEQLHPSLQSLNRFNAYLLNTLRGLIFIIGNDTSCNFFQQIFGLDSYSELPSNGNVQLPQLNNPASFQLNRFIKKLQKERPIGSELFIVNNNFQSNLVKNSLIHLLEEKSETSSYCRFLKFIHRKIIS